MLHIQNFAHPYLIYEWLIIFHSCFFTPSDDSRILGNGVRITSPNGTKMQSRCKKYPESRPTVPLPEVAAMALKLIAALATNDEGRTQLKKGSRIRWALPVESGKIGQSRIKRTVCIYSVSRVFYNSFRLLITHFLGMFSGPKRMEHIGGQILPILSNFF